MKFYKWLFVICFIIVFVNFNNLYAIASEAEIDTSMFGYEKNEDGTITITSYDGTNESVIIPSEIDGMSVSEIGRHAFLMCDCDLKTVNIPSSVKIIGEYAFESCVYLQSVYLSDGIEKISKYAFESCVRLQIINIPNSVKIIEDEAFMDCKSLEKITIPSTVTSVNADAFSFCSLLTIYTDSDSSLMKEIMGGHRLNLRVMCINHPQIITDEAFPPTCAQDGKTEGSHCPICDYKIPQEIIKATGQHIWDEGIVTLEPTVRRKGTKEFTCIVCKNSKTEILDKLPVPKIGSIITNSDASYRKERNSTVEYLESQKSKVEITIPDTVTIDGITYKVTAISKNAFKNNKKLKKVTIGKNVTQIEANAFNGCKNLKTITIKSKNIKSIGKNAFKGINTKAKIKVPSSKLTKYKKLFKGKGQKSTVKITK